MTSNYITPKGAQKLREEFSYLWKVKRPEVTKAVSEAAALGDRSENAEYIYGKKQLREIDRRLRFLKKRLETFTIVERPPNDQSKIYFGAWVTLESEKKQILEYRIVGSDEFDIKSNMISIDSPLARALLKKSINDEIEITLPSSKRSYKILAVKYAET